MATKFSPFEILTALLALSQGVSIKEVADQLRTTTATVYRWRHLYPRDTERMWALLRLIDKKGKVRGDSFEWLRKINEDQGFPWPSK